MPTRFRKTILLSTIALGIASASLAPARWLVNWPLLVVYFVLVWKEYAMGVVVRQRHSSRGDITWRRMMMAVGAAGSVLLAFSFAHPVRFALLAAAFSALQAVQYASDLAVAGNSVLRGRIVKMNVVESALALLVLPAIWLSYTQLALALWGVLSTDIALYFIIFRSVGGESIGTLAST